MNTPRTSQPAAQVVMPVFGSKRETTPPDNTATTTNEQERKGSRFGRRSVDNRTDNSSITTTTSQGQKRGGFLGIGGKNTTDPTILAAREKVTAAEQAEREADRILAAARQAVVQAREHARKLEVEAEEEARLAKIKQDESKNISQRSGVLGRHGPPH